MRIANLTFLILFATASCDWRTSSRSAMAQAEEIPALASLSAPEDGARPEGDLVCGAAFEAVGHGESAAFLAELSGLWIDDLSAPLLVDGQAAEDGLLINASGVFPSQFAMTEEGVEPIALEQRRPEAISIGPVSEEGFRIIQLDFDNQKDCQVYAFKIERPSADMPPTLLLRGPLHPLGRDLMTADAFHAATRESTRLFSAP